MNPPSPPSRRLAVATPEALIVALALLLRLLLVAHATWLPLSDTRDYHVLAQNLASGQGYQQRYEGGTDAYKGAILYAYRMPGYPVFLAALYSLFGWNPGVAYAANVLCDLVVLLLLGRWGRELVGERAALLAQALFGLHVLWTVNLMTESLFTALFLLGAFGLARGWYARSVGHALAVGALVAAAFFVRPIALVLLALLALPPTTAALRPALRHRALVLLPLLLAIALWGARNERRLGEVVLLSTNFGPHNAEAFGINRNRTILALREQGLNEAGWNRVLTGMIVQRVRDEPGQAARIYGQRLVALFSRQPTWEIHSLLWEQTFRGVNGSPAVEALFRALYAQYAVTYPLALLGLLRGLARWLNSPRTLLPAARPALLVASFALLHPLLSDGNIRFAAPLYPFVCLAAAHALAWLGARRVRRARRLGAAPAS